MKFIRRQEFVEAVQFQRGNKREVKAFAEGLVVSNPANRDSLHLYTAGGNFKSYLWPGMWLVRYADGSVEATSNEVFAATYELYTEPTTYQQICGTFEAGEEAWIDIDGAPVEIEAIGRHFVEFRQAGEYETESMSAIFLSAYHLCDPPGKEDGDGMVQ